MRRVEKFLQLHKQLETTLREKFHSHNGPSYYALLDKASDSGEIIIRRNKDFLRSLGDLRNIRAYPVDAQPGYI
jgi:hypothetical protein